MNLEEVIWARKLSRRSFLGGGAALLSAAMLPRLPAWAAAARPLKFTELARSQAADAQVADGYSIQRIISWGDGLLSTHSSFDVNEQTAQSQAERFGYNNDYLAYLPLAKGAAANKHGLLHVNHEYPTPSMMFPEGTDEALKVAVMQQSVGFSTLELRYNDGWQVVQDSAHTRRVTATSPIAISGPAAGDVRMRTTADPAGQQVLGTLANCAGGVTPWGTVLTAEENFNLYFGGELPEDKTQLRHFKRYRVGKNDVFGWSKHDVRFDISTEPNEPNRFGWLVEYDPYDATRMPVKRTALGRFKHEAGNHALAPDGRVVIYSGDDEVYEYLYRFVTAKPYDRENRAANWGLLDEGTLSVAKFLPSGELHWLPLVYGQNGLDESNGFASQADVVIEARRAGDIVGATPMDRPEDVEVNPKTNTVFASLSKNKTRKPSRVEPANSRGPNPFGHILELVPPAGDHAAERFSWEVFLEGGNPKEPAHQAYYINAPSANGWLANPDNFAFDNDGRMWITTDGQGDSIGYNDGIYAVECVGNTRGRPRLFFNAPAGAEATGPYFTPDGTTLFVSIQHPGIEPVNGWPDFSDALPPRPSVIAIRREDGTPIGG